MAHLARFWLRGAIFVGLSVAAAGAQTPAPGGAPASDAAPAGVLPGAAAHPSSAQPERSAAASITPPRLLSPATAPWPAGTDPGSDRTVMVVVTVGNGGAVEDAAIEASAGAPFDAAALTAARGFQFTPARDATGPRRARVRVLVRFVGTGTPESPAASPLPSPAPLPTAPPPEPPSPEPPPAPAASAAVNIWGTAPPRSASDSVIQERELRAAPHQSASETLMVVPGVFVSQHGGEGKAHQIFFRGFDAVHGQDVEIWAGGAPVNEVSNIHGQGYADLHFVIPEVIERIQSTPGNYDPRQADFAVAGTLRLSLGYDEPGVTAKAALGSFGRRRYFLGYHPPAASAATFAAFELTSSDGFGSSRAARHGSAMAQIEQDIGPVTARLMASAYAGRFDSAGVLRLADIESGSVDRFSTYDGKQGGYSSRTQLVLEVSDHAAGGVEPERWTLSPYVVFRTLSLRSNFTGYLTSPEGDSTQQLNETTTLGGSGTYRRRLHLLSERDGIEAGVSMRSDVIRQSQHRLSLLDDRVTDDAASPGIDASVRAASAAGYLDVALHPLQRLTLRGGLRADALSFMTEDRGGGAQGQTRSALGGQLSKRGSADVAVLPGLHALMSYGEGFRSPQARSLGDGETTPFTRVVSLDLGLRYRYEEQLQSSLALFHTRLSDDLVFDPAAARGELVPATRRLGAALNVVFEPTEIWIASGSFTYSRASFDGAAGPYARGDLMPYVPQIVARADAAVTPTLGHFARGGALRSHLGVGLTYLGRRPLPYAEFGHDAFTIDARAALRLGPLETSLDVYNLLDAAWYDGEFVYASAFGGAASLVPERHVTVGPPRTLVWSLTLSV